MLWAVDFHLHNLTATMEARDKSAIRGFCDDLIARIYKTAEPYPLNPAKKLPSALRKRRFFEQMERLADAFISDRRRLDYGPQAICTGASRPGALHRRVAGC